MNKMYVGTFFVGVLAFISFTALQVDAHGDGYSFETTIDGYLIDIGVSEEEPVTDELVRFDFTTSPEVVSSTTDEVFTDVWVSITQDKKVYFSGNVHKPIFGPTGINLTFAEPGAYTVSARFQNAGEKVVEASFPLTVANSGGSVVTPAVGVGGAVGFVFGIFIGFIFFRRRGSV